jgi:hypothetical protein
MLQAANSPNNNSRNLEAHSLKAVLLIYSVTACGFCPACRANPAASR